MKPSKHNNPDSWRRDDVNLRRALQQRNSNLPLLPEGFADRLMEKIEEEDAVTASTKPATKTKRRYLWPIIGTALSTAALLALVFILNRPSSDSQQTLARDEEKVYETVEANETHEDNETNEADKTHEDNETHEVNTPLKADRIYAANQSHSSNEPANEPVDEPVNEPSQPADTSATPSPATPHTLSPVDLDHLDHLVADAVKNKQSHYKKEVHSTGSAQVRSAREEHKASRQLLALAVNVGTAGGLNSGGVNEGDDIENYIGRVNKPLSNGKPANYYLAAGNGYTYNYTKSYNDDSYTPSLLITPVEETHHQLPFSAGVSLRLPLTDRWALSSGLTYTLLTSTFDNGMIAYYDHTTQRLHYLGIPLRCDVQLFRRRHWSIYADLGGSVEIPLQATTRLESVKSDGEVTFINEKRLHAPVQFSIGGGAGVQYSFNNHLGIYAEPQLQWFVPTSSSIETYRTVHPFHFVPSFGIRWEL